MHPQETRMDPSPSSGGEGNSFEPIAAAGEACAVKLPIFEGPLDLLLHLIRQNELDITDLPMARIAEQYLEYLGLMQELQLDVAAEYLLMAATLTWIKSRMLLPSHEEGGEEEGPDPRAELVARLLEYQRYKEAAQDLAQRPRLERDVFAARGPGPQPLPQAEREIEVGLVELLEALRVTLRRARASHAVHEVLTEGVTVEERMKAVMEGLEQREVLELVELFCGSDGTLGSRTWIVATFLAILELARLATLRIYQGLGAHGHPEGPIRLRRAIEPGDTRWRAAVSELG
jgi:segregation and condensation protein A